MATTGQNDYVLNIVELQNTVTSATGLSPQAFLSNQLVQIQQMVNYDAKQINVNVISNFDATPIQIVAPINLSNVALTATGTDATIGSGSLSTTSGGGGLGSVSSIGTGAINGSLEVGVNNQVALLLNANTASTFFIEHGGDATFIGTVYGQNFVTPSDSSLKTKVKRVCDYETVLGALNGVRFEWKGTGEPDIGLLAQEVKSVLPEAVVEDSYGRLHVAYRKVVPVLVEAVKALQARVLKLEAAIGQFDEI